MKQPERAVKFYLEIDGDTREDVEHAIEDLARQFSMGEIAAAIGPGISASPSWSWVYHYVEKDHPTHDAYFIALNEWLERKREEHGVGEVKT